MGIGTYKSLWLKRPFITLTNNDITTLKIRVQKKTLCQHFADNTIINHKHNHLTWELQANLWHGSSMPSWIQTVPYVSPPPGALGGPPSTTGGMPGRRRTRGRWQPPEVEEHNEKIKEPDTTVLEDVRGAGLFKFEWDEQLEDRGRGTWEVSMTSQSGPLHILHDMFPPRWQKGTENLRLSLRESGDLVDWCAQYIYMQTQTINVSSWSHLFRTVHTEMYHLSYCRTTSLKYYWKTFE